MLNEPGSPMTVRQQRREETRRRLLDAALDEFVAHGFGGASTRRITAAAGVSEGLLFHHFSSKEQLFVELVRLGTTTFTVDRELADSAPLAHLQASAEDVLALLAGQPRAARVFVLMEQARSHPGAAPEADALLARHDLVRESVPVVEAGQRLGEIRAGSPLALSLLFWSALQGVAQEVHARPGVDLPPAAWVVDMLRPRPI